MHEGANVLDILVQILIEVNICQGLRISRSGDLSLDLIDLLLIVRRQSSTGSSGCAESSRGHTVVSQITYVVKSLIWWIANISLQKGYPRG